MVQPIDCRVCGQPYTPLMEGGCLGLCPDCGLMLIVAKLTALGPVSVTDCRECGLPYATGGSTTPLEEVDPRTFDARRGLCVFCWMGCWEDLERSLEVSLDAQCGPGETNGRTN
jgi:hypothetical protein